MIARWILILSLLPYTIYIPVVENGSEPMSLYDGLVSWYALSDANDGWGTNHLAPAGGGPAYVAGKVGNAAQFNSAHLYRSAFPGFTTNRTFAFWAKYTDALDTRAFFYFTIGLWDFLVGCNNGFLFTSGGETQAPLSPNDWHFIGIILESGQPDGSYLISVYVDGQPYGPSGTASQKQFSGDFTIGTYYSGAVTVVDELGIWDRALTEAEFDTLYNNGNGLALSGLTAHITPTPAESLSGEVAGPTMTIGTPIALHTRKRGYSLHTRSV